MKPAFSKELAKLMSEGAILGELNDSDMGELIFFYHEGELEPKDAKAVELLLQTSDKAHKIHQRLKAADEFVASDAGKAWLESLPDRVMKKPR